MFIEPMAEDQEKKVYSPFLNPKKWASESKLKINYDKNEITFGNGNLDFIYREGETKTLDATLGNHTFGVELKGGIKFHYKKKENK